VPTLLVSVGVSSTSNLSVPKYGALSLTSCAFECRKLRRLYCAVARAKLSYEVA
jgi:hypothetical protein